MAMDGRRSPMKPIVIVLAALTAAALSVDYGRQQAKIPSRVERLPPPPPLPPFASFTF